MPGTNESQSKSLTMLDKVKLLLIPKSKINEMYNEMGKCLFEESFPLMEINNF